MVPQLRRAELELEQVRTEAQEHMASHRSKDVFIDEMRHTNTELEAQLHAANTRYCIQCCWHCPQPDGQV